MCIICIYSRWCGRQASSSSIASSTGDLRGSYALVEIVAFVLVCWFGCWHQIASWCTLEQSSCCACCVFDCYHRHTAHAPNSVKEGSVAAVNRSKILRINSIRNAKCSCLHQIDVFIMNVTVEEPELLMHEAFSPVRRPNLTSIMLRLCNVQLQQPSAAPMNSNTFWALEADAHNPDEGSATGIYIS
jgi:hypothetical protein